MTRRAYYKKVLYYEESFAKDLDEFEELILKDEDIDKLNLQDKLHRFSGAIRWLIRRYNIQKGPKIREIFNNKPKGNEVKE